MKRVLITGKDSYVGTNVEKWLMKEPDKYYVETLDMKDPNWKDFDFSKFDVVFHVAGIAHVSNKKSMKELYYKVNRDLAIEVAIKTKEERVEQFVFMSSMIIYGKDNPLVDNENINIEKFNPISDYGRSKLEADLGIQKLTNEKFNVSIIRTPVIYGPGCKGNFPKLQKISKKLFIVPNINNQRSMIFIENFAEFVKKLIDNRIYGIYYPQNKEYLGTSEILIYSRESIGKKTLTTTLFNPLIKVLTKLSSFFRKIYGNKTYDLSLSHNLDFDYVVLSNKESIIKSMQ